MVVYLALLIPVILGIVLYIFYRHKVVWWEVTIPMAVTLVFILIAKWIAVSSLTTDTEWWGGYVTEVRYYEPWDEEVPCTHSKYCEQYNSCCRKDSNGNCEGCIEEYQCGYEHAYDVDYHHEYWMAETTLGEYNIDHHKYEVLVQKFGTGKNFVDMHRDYHSKDGDMYSTIWDNDNNKLEPVAQSHSYENKPAASKSIYHYDEVDTFEIKTFKPFSYPNVYDQYKQKTLLGYENSEAQHHLDVLNSLLGHSKQVRVFLLVFKNQSREAGLVQERYWEGGNKNEIVICVGIDDQETVQWGHVFSWTEQTGIKIKIRNIIESETKLNLNQILDFTWVEIDREWERKQFKDFDYLTIEPSSRAVLIIFILAVLINIGLGFWIVLNEIDDYGQKKSKKYWR